VITDRFNYVKINREAVEGKRLYATPDGKKVPSVTTILSATVSEEKKRVLSEWRDRVGHEQAQKITTEAAARGTRMHTFLENYIKDGALGEKPANPFSWASHAMADTIINNGLKNVDEYWGVEIPVYFPGIYAGTTDLAGVHAGSEAIMDHKQSNKWKLEEWIDDYKIQLAAYAEAHNEVHGTKINKGVVFMAVKPKMNEQTMEIIEPPKYQEFVIEGAEFDKWRKVWWDRVEQYYKQQ
jgi:hypothetical protein